MTKRRAPISIPEAVTEIIAGIGDVAAAEAVAKSVRHLRRWSDPDGESKPTLEQALQLDRAFLAAGHEVAPIFDVYRARIEQALRLARPAEAGDPHLRLMRAMAEFGDVSRVMAGAMADGKLSAAERADILREAQQAVAQLNAMIDALEHGAERRAGA